MAFKLFGSKKQEPTPAPEPPAKLWASEFLADREKRTKMQRVMIELVEQTKLLTKKDIAKWRSAWQRAISVEWPSRIELLDVYRDVDIDNHLMAVFGQIYNEVLQKEIKVVDRTSGEELPDQTKLLEDAQWFIDFCLYALQSCAFGFSPIQFGDVITENGITKFSEVELLEREHFIPEHHVFVKNQSDHFKNGFDYNERPYSDWLIVVGNKKDLGMYNKVARHAISKKNIEAFWDKFAEIFGMPIRIGKTNSKNPNDRNEMSEMLQKMGSAAWGLFNDDSSIEIKETTRGDAYEVYDKRIDRANSEMSKAIVNQTMTTDNGSSKAQGTVHLEIQENVIEFHARRLRVILNDKLIPFMLRHGFAGWENARFSFDDTVETSPEQQQKVEEMILSEYDVEPEYFAEKYNIPIIGKKAVPKNPFDPKNKGGFFD